MKIITNPDIDKHNEVRQAVNENEGFCPCVLTKTADTKCPCKNFREQTTEGECHCGLYVKIKEGE